MTIRSRRLAQLEEIPDGTARGFDPLGDGEPSLFIVRQGETLYAYRDRCPHQGSRMAWRRDAYLNRSGDRIVCYGHGAEFAVANGQCVSGPCLGQGLERVNLEVSEEGDIFISEPAYG